MKSEDQKDDGLLDIFDRLVLYLNAAGKEKVSLDRIMIEMGVRSYGPLLMFFSFLTLSPVGSIPGGPTFFGAIIFLTVVQIVAGKNEPWLPGIIKKYSFPVSWLEYLLKRTRKMLGQASKILPRRLPSLTGKYVDSVIAIPVGSLAALMIPLEIIPSAVFLPAFFIFIFGVALLTRKGMLVLINYTLMLLAVLSILFMFW